ncbi:MAG: alpha/beta fold hydrolase, partial [Actinomycetota bacterium]
MLDHDAEPVAWREAGPPDGDVVLFLHGLGMTRTGWDSQLAALADRWRCVAWDMPGYGASPALDEPLTFAAIADSVAALLDTLDADGAHLVGLSFGGMHALHTALRHPTRVRSLTLADTSPAFGLDGVTTREGWVRARLAALDAGATPADIAPAVLDAISGPGFTGEPFEAAVASMSRIDAEGLRTAVHLLPDHDVQGRGSEITA